MLCSDHLRPAAIAAGVLKKDQDVRFGYHTMRHSLASFLVGRGETQLWFKSSGSRPPHLASIRTQPSLQNC